MLERFYYWVILMHPKGQATVLSTLGLVLGVVTLLK